MRQPSGRRLELLLSLLVGLAILLWLGSAHGPRALLSAPSGPSTSSTASSSPSSPSVASIASGPGQRVEAFDLLLGTYVRITLPAEGSEPAAEAAMEEVRQLDRLLDRFRDDSDVARINGAPAGRWVSVDPRTAEVVARALEAGVGSDGALDITIAPLVDLWRFSDQAKERAVPNPERLHEVLGRLGLDKVEADPEAARVRRAADAVQIDLGAIAKGYAVDRAVAVLRRRGVTSGLVDAGGNLYAIGTKPGGGEWRIGIKDPRHPESLMATVPLSDAGIATSGDYQRYFEQDGVRYHHILDPATGMPSRGLRSATVVAPDATAADALSTAVFVLGPEKGMALVESLPGVEAILVGDQGVWVSSGLSQRVEWAAGFEAKVAAP